MVALEGGLDAQFFQAGFSSLLKIEGCGARLDLRAHQFEHLADHLARAAHLFDLLDDLSTTAN